MYNKKPPRLTMKDKQICGVEGSLPIPNGLAIDELYTNGYSSCYNLTSASVVVVVGSGVDVPPTAKVIRRRDLGLKSHPKDWRSPGSNSRPLVYNVSSLITTSRRLLVFQLESLINTNTEVLLNTRKYYHNKIIQPSKNSRILICFKKRDRRQNNLVE